MFVDMGKKTVFFDGKSKFTVNHTGAGIVAVQDSGSKKWGLMVGVFVVSYEIKLPSLLFYKKNNTAKS